jgi:mannose-1-phosphate guanylyltransferase
MKAMILAAGLGTRLLPYTLKRPKPLFPILNKPLLQLTVDRVKLAGATEIVVNAHHLKQQIKRTLQGEENIILQEEEKILGTGGGLRMALPHLGPNPVLVVNGDIYHSIDYREIYNSHNKAKADVTLVLHDYPRFNDVVIDDRNSVIRFNRLNDAPSKQEKILAFTGIHVINPDVLQHIPPDTTFCIIDCYRKLLDMGGTIRAYVATKHFWTDMGTPADYRKLHAELLAQKAPVYEELAGMVNEGPFVGVKNASIEKDVKLRDWVCIGKGATVKSGVILQRTVVWDGAVVPAGSIIKDAIVTP